MSRPSRELLVILEAGHAGRALADVRVVATVTQVLAPRLALVRVEPDAHARLVVIEGVLGVYDDAPPALPDDFTAAERAFVSGWALRQQTKQRAGDGLSWGDAGFDPPDRPTKRRP